MGLLFCNQETPQIHKKSMSTSDKKIEFIIILKLLIIGENYLFLPFSITTKNQCLWSSS